MTNAIYKNRSFRCYGAGTAMTIVVDARNVVQAAFLMKRTAAMFAAAHNLRAVRVIQNAVGDFEEAVGDFEEKQLT